MYLLTRSWRNLGIFLFSRGPTRASGRCLGTRPSRGRGHVFVNPVVARPGPGHLLSRSWRDRGQVFVSAVVARPRPNGTADSQTAPSFFHFVRAVTARRSWPRPAPSQFYFFRTITVQRAWRRPLPFFPTKLIGFRTITAERRKGGRCTGICLGHYSQAVACPTAAQVYFRLSPRGGFGRGRGATTIQFWFGTSWICFTPGAPVPAAVVRPPPGIFSQVVARPPVFFLQCHV